MARGLSRWVRLGLFALLGLTMGAIGVALRGDRTPSQTQPQASRGSAAIAAPFIQP